MHGMIGMARKKPGPKPKEGDRYPSGKLKPPEKQIVGQWTPTHIRRAMDNTFILARNPILSSELGRMLMRGEITSREAAAGFQYGAATGAWERMHGKRRHAKSPAYDEGFKSSNDIDIDGLALLDPAAAEQIKDKLLARKREIEKKLQLVRSAVPDMPIIASTIVEEVCCNDGGIHSAHLPGFKAILRRIADKLKLENTDEAGARHAAQADDTKSVSEDAEHLGMSAIEAMEHWAASGNITITGFEVESAQRGQWQKLTVEGNNRDGEIVEKSTEIMVHGMLSGALNRRLTLWCERKGWKRRAK